MMNITQSIEDTLGAGVFEAAPFFLYLYRRYGPTQFGSDPDREVCVYALPTQQNGLWVTIRIGATNVTIDAAMTKDLFDRYTEEEVTLLNQWRDKRNSWAKANGVRMGRNETISKMEQEAIDFLDKIYPVPSIGKIREECPIIDACYSGVEAVLKDLKTAVKVGDIAIDIFGNSHDVETGTEPFWGAGYGTYHDAYRDPDLWISFMDWLKEQGNGDRLSYIKKLVSNN